MTVLNTILAIPLPIASLLITIAYSAFLEISSMFFKLIVPKYSSLSSVITKCLELLSNDDLIKSVI